MYFNPKMITTKMFQTSTVECQNPNVRKRENAEIQMIDHLVIYGLDFERSDFRFTLIFTLKCRNPNVRTVWFRFQTKILVRNLNEIVRISDIFEIRTILQLNDFGLSEIGTRSDFSIPLYYNFL